MKRYHVIALMAAFLLAGCASGTGGAVAWNPFTWMARVAPAAADRAQVGRDEAAAGEGQAAQAAVDAAHREVAKTGEVLASAPVGREVDLARRFNGNALGLLGQVRAIPATEAIELRALVRDLLSENQATVERAESRQLRDEKRLEAVSSELVDARAKLERKNEALAAANASLREAYDRENALANKVRNFWFIAGLLVFLWIAGNFLAVGARFVPALAPVSAAINGIAAPALAFAEARARGGLQRVGEGIAYLRKNAPEIAEKVVGVFNDKADEDHKTIIAAGANAAGAGPDTKT